MFFIISYLQDICTQAHIMSEHSSWDGEKTVIITCRYSSHSGEKEDFNSFT